ncbi:MAG: flippase-like domain-containing protein [Proteobacteria bacterium]|nr:flippase-like domain-containing protein [Pseudomonadota bacterium]MBU1711277.1 flippase-like domain-containing protein [Pseudomonadota bacterium]
MLSFKKTIIPCIKLTLTAGIFYYLISSGKLNLSKLGLLIDAPATLSLLLGIFLLIIIPLTSLRWLIILKISDLNISYLRSLTLTWIGNFFNISLPGTVSGDIIKGFYVYRLHRNKGKTMVFMSLLIDRITGLMGLVVMGTVAILFNWDRLYSQTQIQPLVHFILVLFVISVIFFGIILLPYRGDRDRLHVFISKIPRSGFLLVFYLTMKKLGAKPLKLLSTVAISFFIHCCIVFLFLQITKLIGAEPVDPFIQMFIMPFGFIATAIPIAPGGIGVGHAAFETLYSMMGIKGGADIFNLYIVIQLTNYMFGGIIYFFYKNEYNLSDVDKQELTKNQVI